jgi:8-oxo-dGTP pyrophosphatase MutT (NUDIX family)
MQGAAIAFIKNELGDLLIVKPNYLGTDDWSLPGGVIEEGESPIEACKRECLEELGIHITVGKLLCLEHRKATHPEGETNKFIFDCGVLLPEQQKFTLQLDEIDAAVFKPVEEAMRLVSKVMRRRLEAIQKEIVYYEL